MEFPNRYSFYGSSPLNLLVFKICFRIDLSDQAIKPISFW